MDKIYFPEITKFDELVESQRLIYSHNDEMEPDEILCSVHTQWEFNYYAVKISKNVREIYDSMRRIVNDPHITMRLDYYRCGEWVDKALATLDYNKIFGNRWLAWIDIKSLGIKPVRKLKSEEITNNVDKNQIKGNNVIAGKNVIKILGEAVIEGNVIKLNSGQLDRKDYADVNKVLETMGGKWNKKQGGHVFKNDPTDILNQVLESGSITDKKKETQFYATPESIVDELIDIADIQNGMIILEPSAGDGAIVDKIVGCNVKAVEYDKERYEVLKSKGIDVDCEDFIKWAGNSTDKFDRVIMNPPFSKGQDISHVMFAYGLLKDSGKLVAVMSQGFTFKSDKKSVEFRELVEAKGGYKENKHGDFKESGTSVKTVIVWIDK